MPYRDKQKAKEYKANYQREHKDDVNSYHRVWGAKNRQKRNEYQRQWNAKNKDKVKAIQQRNGQIIKLKVLIHYGNGKCACVRCGFGDVRCLSIDHIDGGGSVERKDTKKIGKAFYRWLMKNYYPNGFQTLCMNCQFIKKYENNEWYSRIETYEQLKSFREQGTLI